MINMVLTRDGRSVIFDRTRIQAAIEKAAQSVGVSELPLSSLVDTIIQKLSSLDDGQGEISLERIQDCVEQTLAESGQFSVARAYIVYRNKRAESRLASLQKEKQGEFQRVVDAVASRVDGTHELHLQELVDLAPQFIGLGANAVPKALEGASASLVERDPLYAKLAAQFLYQRWMGELGGLDYQSLFVDGIRKGIEHNLFDKRLADFNLEEVATLLRPERDNLFDYQGMSTLYERYVIKIKDQVIETPQAFWLRVAMGLVLSDHDRSTKTIETFYTAMSTFKYVPSTPTLFHSGTPRPQLSSCYIGTVNDDLAHIFKVIGDNAQLSKYSGGIGTDWTPIRATGSWIESTKVHSQGVIPFLKIANDATHAINRSGKRRGAACVYLEAWHLDFEDFLDLKRNTGDERRRTHDLNTAAWIPDLFMKRVAEGGEWTFFSPNEVPDLHRLYGSAFEKAYVDYEASAQRGEIQLFKKIEALKLWRKILTRLFETGHPWITFKDPCNIRSPQDHVGVVNSSNLCTEITLNSSEDETAVCNLGSVNLSRFVEKASDGKARFDKLGFAETVKTAVRMLDNAIDTNFYPTIEAKNANMRHRPVGLGMMGFQDALAKLGLAFEDEAAYEFGTRVTELYSFTAIEASSELAATRGAYESFEGSKWSRGIFPQDSLKILEAERGASLILPNGRPLKAVESLDWTSLRARVQKHGLRNSNLMAIAPTATISTIVGCFPGIEPLFKNLYVKSNMTGEFAVINQYLVADLKALGLWNRDMVNMLKYHDGRLENIDLIPRPIRARYRESFDIAPEVFITHNALRSVWIDQSQSHTIFFRGSSGKVLGEVYESAYRAGLKTTYYLRTLGASGIEKSTLDAKVYGFTQKRESVVSSIKTLELVGEEKAAVCDPNDLGCESCQ